MSAQALQEAPVNGRGVFGAVDVSFALRDGKTRLASLYQATPYRVLFPNPEPNEPPTAVITTVSGGLVGGDRLDATITVGPGARALVTTQAAEKAYRSWGPMFL